MLQKKVLKIDSTTIVRHSVNAVAQMTPLLQNFIWVIKSKHNEIPKLNQLIVRTYKLVKILPKNTYYTCMKSYIYLKITIIKLLNKRSETFSNFYFQNAKLMIDIIEKLFVYIINDEILIGCFDLHANIFDNVISFTR